MKRPTTGDLVKIISDIYGRRGQELRIDRDDHSEIPYCIADCWYREHQVLLVGESSCSAERELRVGDRVRVKSCEKCLSVNDFAPQMAAYCGRVVTIAERVDVFFKIIEDNLEWRWSYEMFDLEEPCTTMTLTPLERHFSKPLFRGSAGTATRKNLPLIKTNKLLTNIKLD